jgi:hypothetical protein
MSYTITFTNGKTLAVIADQSVDEVSTSLTLVGKNVNNYGTHINNNFIGLLENFANLTEPRSPVTGQTWFDTSEGRLKVYSTGSFKPIGGPTISNSEPSGAVAGDQWVDTVSGILKWYDGASWIDAGKQYSNVTGKAGWILEYVADVSNTEVPISVFYANDVPVAVMVEDPIEFNPFSGFYIFTSTITTLNPGITLNPKIEDIKFYGTATSAETLGGQSIEELTETITTAILESSFEELGTSIDFVNDEGISVGTLTNIRLYVTGTTKTSVIAGTVEGEPLALRYNSATLGPNATALHVDTANNRVGILTNSPTAGVDINSDVKIRGALTVIGTQTSLEVAVLKVNDKNIELAVSTGTYTNALANGGGIILHGEVDHTFTFNDTLDSWDSSLSVNVLGTSTYKIDGATVLEKHPTDTGYFQLGANVKSAPGLSVLPVQSRFTVSDITMYNSTITTVGPLTDLHITPSSGFINLDNNTKIVNMAETADLDPDSTAVTKKYFDDKLALATGGYQGRKPYVVALDITDFYSINDEIVAYLDTTLPVDGFGNPYYAQPDGSRCSVLCTRYDATTATYFLNNLNTSTVRTLINYISTLSFTATSTTTSLITTASYTSTFVVTDFNLAGSVTISTPMPTITRSVKLFQVISGFWTFVEDVDTNYMSSATPLSITTGTKTLVVNSYNAAFTTTTNVTIRETDTQLNYMTGPITAITGTNSEYITVNVTTAETSGTFSSWIIRLA